MSGLPSPAKLKLYSYPVSRGRIIEWLLKEHGKEADVEIVNVDLREKEHKSAEFRAINPFGKLPALVDGDMKLFESGAILIHLAHKWGEFKTPEDRSVAEQWALFANSTLADSVFVEQRRDQSMPDVFSALDEILAKQPYIAGSSFTVSDVAVGSCLLYIRVYLPQLDLKPYPHVVAYMQRMAERPACAATVAAKPPQP
ncbi:hypothetical protein HYH03_005252 [Edaphochlamys debaryana]|uniref:Glutathione S-transferase n=1 Tax=Edaphochlamys debaryana TaxID=47281 RepID=A0A835Y6D7_9CHLO|nr:hypothetical protein HYH03_005252 [Edaphochlamys debaryana]|eukprot:KAG2496848.1 hypothetical protein HYH03_005252 [Edaphochlamys debaryana]